MGGVVVVYEEDDGGCVIIVGQLVSHGVEAGTPLGSGQQTFSYNCMLVHINEPSNTPKDWSLYTEHTILMDSI